MIAKNDLITNLFYMLIIASIYLGLFEVISTFDNSIIAAILCGILNFYIVKIVVILKNSQLEKTAQCQRETYISTINHDLKIPTLAQIQALRLLHDEKTGKINKKQKEIIELTLDSCSYMYDMLSTILSTYKYENKDMSLYYEKINFLKLIEECFNKSNKSIQNKNLKVNIKSCEDFLVIFADKIQVRKAFENIIDYCVSSANENSQIIFEIKQENKNINISLGFESPYVSVDSMRNLFNKYSTSSDKFDKVGSGLGLYLAKQIIDAHKGRIYADKKISNYNIYKIELPCINDCKYSAMSC